MKCGKHRFDQVAWRYFQIMLRAHDLAVLLKARYILFTSPLSAVSNAGVKLRRVRTRRGSLQRMVSRHSNVACPRQALTAIAECNGLDTTPDKSAVNGDGLSMAVEHVECARQIPEDERTVRCPLVVKLLVISKQQARKEPMGIRLPAKRGATQSACSLPVGSSDCIFDFTGHVRMPSNAQARPLKRLVGHDRSILAPAFFIERQIILDSRELVICAIAVREAYDGITAVWLLNRVNPDSVEIWDVSVTSGMILYLTDDCIDGADYVIA
jgi:hypothetical protein